MGYSLSSEPGKIVVTVHPKFSFSLFAMTPLWVAAWLAAVLKKPGFAQPESILAAVFFGVLTLTLVYAWLWNLGGKEQLEFTPSVFTSRKNLFGISSDRVFSMRRIDRPHFENSHRRGKSRVPSGIGFSYQGRHFRFGDHLTQREAKEIIAFILAQLPELCSCWGNYEEGLPELDEDLSLQLK
jgi:hypothetical protein